MQESFDTFRDFLSDYFACVSYFSLPVFDDSCQIVRSQNLLLRDVLTCNPTNHHVALCGQYDPHYELSEYKMCWRPGRGNIWKKIQEKKYDNVYLLFRTCLKNSISGENSHHISGLYEVDQELSGINPDYNSPCIRAKSLHFISVEDSVNIGYFYKRKPNPRSRFPFNSETNDGIYFDDLKAWTSHILSSEDLSQEYITETIRLNDVYLINEFSQEQYYQECEECESREKCPLVKRIDTKQKVRHYIGNLEAERISININLL